MAVQAVRTESESLGRFREQYEELERLRVTAREAVVLAQTESARIREQTQAEDARRRLEAASELSAYEPKLRELRGEQDRLNAAANELARQRELFTADKDVLDKARATFEAHQAAETERLMTWENTLVDRAAEQSVGQRTRRRTGRTGSRPKPVSGGPGSPRTKSRRDGGEGRPRSKTASARPKFGWSN